MIETPDYEAGWKTWKASPTPTATAGFMKQLDPVIDKAARSQVGEQGMNPLVKSRARVITLKALQGYDPQQGRLVSHLYNHMQGLKRYTAQTAAGIHVPERVALDRRAVDASHQELHDELGRDPTDDELADRSGFSTRRISHVRKYNPAMSSGYFDSVGEATGDAEGSFDPAVNSTPSSAWENIIISEMTPIDQLIVKHTRAGMMNQDIAAKLRLSPGAISQRKLKIQQKLDAESGTSPL